MTTPIGLGNTHGTTHTGSAAAAPPPPPPQAAPRLTTGSQPQPSSSGTGLHTASHAPLPQLSNGAMTGPSRSRAPAHPPSAHATGQVARVDVALADRVAQIQDAFAGGGLLVRSCQMKHAHLDFNHDLDIEPRPGQPCDGGYLRKFVLAQQDLVPNFYKMGPEVAAMPRCIGVLTLPDKMGDHLVGIHATDQASNAQPTGKSYLDHGTASARLASVLAELKADQAERPGQPLDNNEIQAVGVPPDALAGLLFSPNSALGGYPDWEAAKPAFQQVADKMHACYDGQQFPVFGYRQEGNGPTELVHIDSVTVRPGQS
ncbi:hypothetical protein [Chitinimonas koreensis]|uniref:hypothetical protein n=1 Tax=Chitinimonas koreensis TaxID=356302 RepID=UPI00040235E4|nr:hypothetical protein [Chitinimonas koreensis]QNM95077.1 hypothetical protein H9L41_14330 [Chitinimonas koreensis]